MTPGEGPTAGSDGIRVLLVDDSDHFVRAARRTLALEDGIQVVGTAGSAAEAVAAVRRLAPDVVLMDMSMPGESGLDATRSVRAVSPETPVIILTAHETDAYDEAAREAGAAAVVGKWMLLEQAVPEIRRLARAAPTDAD